MGKYLRLIRLQDEHFQFGFALAQSRREKAMQEAVGYMKPISWLLVPYIIFWLPG